MKKLLGSTLSLAMVFTYSPASAEVLKNFKLSGSIEVQATSADNVTDFATGPTQTVGGATNRDRIGDAETRVLLHADWDLLDDVHSKVTLSKRGRAYGTAAQNGDAIQTAIVVEQAHIKIDKLADSVDLTLGRQFYNETAKNEMVVFFGPRMNSFGMQVTGLDAARFDWGNDAWGLTGIVGKTADGALGTVPDASTDLRGLVATIKGNESWNAGAYIWNQVIHRSGAAVGAPPSAGAAGGKNDFLWVAGLKGKVMAEGAWLAGEFAKNFGQNRFATTAGGGDVGAQSYTGWAAKLDAGYKAELSGMGTLEPWLHVGIGSGDGSPNDNQNHAFTPIASDYRPGAIYGRFASAFIAGTQLGGGVIGSNSISDRKIWGVGLKATPEAVNKLTAGLSFYDYSRSANPGRATGGTKHMGSELDIDATWKHSENVSINTGVGRFFPGAVAHETNQGQDASAFGPGSANSQKGTNAVSMAWFDVSVRF